MELVPRGKLRVRWNKNPVGETEGTVAEVDCYAARDRVRITRFLNAGWCELADSTPAPVKKKRGRPKKVRPVADKAVHSAEDK